MTVNGCLELIHTTLALFNTVWYYVNIETITIIAKQPNTSTCHLVPVISHTEMTSYSSINGREENRL